jgi:flagellar secretion chaperone FliS
MNYNTVRNRYLDDTVRTANPAVLLTMLYDRLVLDLERAEAAQRAGDRAEGGKHLLHAQDIVSELAATLDVDAWDGGPRLMSVYSFLLTELVNANVTADAERTVTCRQLVEPLQRSWHEAASSLATVAVPGSVPGPAVAAAVPVQKQSAESLGFLGVA